MELLIVFDDRLSISIVVTVLCVLITCFFFFPQGDDFRGFEAERKASKGSRQNPSKGKDKLHMTIHI